MINIILSALIASSFAQSSTQSLVKKQSSDVKNSEVSEKDTIYVFGSKEKTFYTPGSAHFIDQKELEVFSYEDVSRILDKVPGVYIQEEDGLGLRPNIGLRGAHPHRSKKVTLMEDGVLVGPAPYASPAAYYFPTTSKISSMEVFKGPSSVQYGPNSVGGAINMVTRPYGEGNMVEVTGGQFNQVHAYSSTKNWIIEGIHKQGNLIRELDNGENFEFSQNDITLKYKKSFGGQKFSIKTSYSDEASDETYLGTTASDYNSDPYTRYRASQDDQINWQRYAFRVDYKTNLLSNLKVNNTIYHHYMRRNWEKFNNLNFNQDFRTTLSTGVDPDNLVSLLRGDINSESFSELLKIGANDRTYFSQGVQSKLELAIDTGVIAHNIELGVRLHRDQVRRNHSEKLAAMVGGDLVYQDNTYMVTNSNQDTSNALAVFLEDEMMFGDITAKIGFRAERVEHERDARDGNDLQTNDESVFVPGVGINYSITPNIVALAGVNKGVTLVGPGQDPSVLPEEAINYEFGFRVRAPVYLETVAFYSDYSNLKGTCSFSSGCDENDLDIEFNGGAAEVYGIESSASHSFSSGKWSFPIRLSHTFTVARFKSEFVNTNPEWGPTLGDDRTIRVNDPMPYIPQNQVNLGLGMGYDKFSMDLNFLWKGQMADQAVAENRQFVPSYGLIDSAVSYRYTKKGRVFFRMNNILDNQYLVSFRPFGARPGAPRTATVGINQRF